MVQGKRKSPARKSPKRKSPGRPRSKSPVVRRPRSPASSVCGSAGFSPRVLLSKLNGDNYEMVLRQLPVVSLKNLLRTLRPDVYSTNFNRQELCDAIGSSLAGKDRTFAEKFLKSERRYSPTLTSRGKKADELRWNRVTGTSTTPLNPLVTQQTTTQLRAASTNPSTVSTNTTTQLRTSSSSSSGITDYAKSRLSSSPNKPLPPPQSLNNLVAQSEPTYSLPSYNSKYGKRNVGKYIPKTSNEPIVTLNGDSEPEQFEDAVEELNPEPKPQSFFERLRSGFDQVAGQGEE